MHKIWVISKREYLTRVRTVMFVASTILTPLVMIAWVMAPSYFAARSAGKREVVVLNQSGDPGLFALLQSRLGGGEHHAGPTLRDLFELDEKIIPPGGNLDEIRSRFEHQQTVGQPKALLILGPGVLQAAPAEYVGPTLNDPAIIEFARVVESVLTATRMASSGFDRPLAMKISSAPSMKLVRMATNGRVAGEDAESVALIMLTTMYTVTFLYGMWVLRGVSSEKRSRIAEVLLTAAKPVELMAGKLLGLGFAGLTQCAIWVLAAALLSAPGIGLASHAPGLPQISAEMLLYFLAYFLLGYFLYATLFALAGASSTSTDEGQQIMMPLIMLQIVPMVVFFAILRDPNGTSSVVLSMIPFFSPTLMILRLAVTHPPVWQVAASFGLMLASILISLWATAKVYRAGILMSGKRLTLPELVRWLRYA